MEQIQSCCVHNARSVFHPSLPFAVLLCLFSGAAWATDVTFRLVDQNGDLIPVSRFFAGGTFVSQNGTVSLAVGNHTVDVLPGRNGQLGDGF